MGSDENVSRLFLKHRHMLMDYVQGLVRSAEDAEDIFQEVGLRVLAKSEAPATEGEFAAWCRGIARNLVLHHWRTKSRAKVVASGRLLDIVDRAYSEADEQRELWAERRSALGECLKQLPERSRALLEHRYRLGRTSAELGSRLKRSAAAIRVTISRIRKKIQECVERRAAAGMVQ